MKKIKISILFISVIIALCVYSLVSGRLKDKIVLNFTISDLTESEFESLGIKELDKSIKNDFKNIELHLDVKDSILNSNRYISIPSIKNIINTYDKKRYWSGKSTSQDNEDEGFAKYTEEIVFYSKGLDEKTIKDIFTSSEVKINMSKKVGESNNNVYILGDILEFR